MKTEDNKKNLFVMLVVGIFILLVGVMGFVRSPEFMDMAMLISGGALASVSAYKLFIK